MIPAPDVPLKLKEFTVEEQKPREHYSKGLQHSLSCVREETESEVLVVFLRISIS